MVVKIPRAKVLRRCVPPLRQVTAYTRVMKGPAIEKQALHGTTCRIHCRRSRMHRPERALCFPPGGIAAHGGEGKDAAAEARVLSMQEEIVLTVGGERRTRNSNTDEGCC